ncbi:MAG TPA: exosortase B [Rhodocyclaceae bacterium]|nr:exosortase B [Rhodocyclaceae bacterium]
MTTTDTYREEPDSFARLLPWLLLTAGFAFVYIPTFIDLFRTLWSTDQNAHGPIVLAVGAWFLYFKARQIHADELVVCKPAPLAGGVTLGVGLLLYVIGRSQAFYLFEVGSIIPVLAGVVLVLFGKAVLRRLWFALFFLFFMIPLPGSIIDAMTQPMKIAVSWGAEHVLYALGYPIARNGVVLNIGQYQLLVADACAGLNSLFTLEALGLLYMNVMRHESAFRNVLLAVLIVPISFASNLIRVVVLALITFHLGDDAGQGFLHGFSGMVLFITALLLIIGVDSVLRAGAAFRHRERAA